MARISRIQRLQSLQLAINSSCTSQRSSFVVARGLSTSTTVQSKNTEWVRKKLWQGEAPGAADPYTQQPEQKDTSNLPEEAIDYQPREDKTPFALRNSRLAVPPRRSEAATEKDLESTDPSYVPAESMEDLGEVSSLKSWWDQPGHWGEENTFKGFAATDKVTDRDAIEVYLRRAFVEVLALHETGALSEWSTKKWREGSRSDLDAALAVQVEVQNGQATLKGDATAVADSVTSDVADADISRVSTEEAQELIKMWDASWQDVELNNQLKFAIRKRLYQLTGTLIPDAKLGAATTIKQLLAVASKPPRANRLAEVLASRDAFRKAANVTVHERKIGPIDKEISVGRWKVIEEELNKRGLPITGTGDMQRNKERDWLTGKI